MSREQVIDTDRNEHLNSVAGVYMILRMDNQLHLLTAYITNTSRSAPKRKGIAVFFFALSCEPYKHNLWEKNAEDCTLKAGGTNSDSEG